MRKNLTLRTILTATFLMVLIFSFAVMVGCGGGGGGDDGGGGGYDTGTVTGTVYDNDGWPVQGATVSYEIIYTGKQSNSTTTDSNGQFTLYDVPVGTVLITAVKDSMSAQMEVTVTSSSATEVTLNVAVTGWVDGTVTDINTSQPISGATVKVTEGSQTISSDTTDSSGYYVLSYVPEGTNTVVVSKSGYWEMTSSVSVTGNQTTTLNFTLSPTSGPSPTPTPFKGKVYALLIGVNDYPGDFSDLNYCIADAEDFRTSFQNSAMWSTASITFITDSEATESSIKNAIQTIKASAGSDDLFVMTFSGHGTNTVGNAAICVWSDDLTDWGYIDDQEIGDWIQGMPCASAIFIDSCYSGGLMGKNLTKTVNGDELTARVYAGAPGYKADFKGTFNPGRGRTLQLLNNIVALTASSGAELSWESSSLQNGVFTYYATEGLGMTASAGPADTNNNGSVSSEEVYRYSQPKVLDYSNDDQHPQMVDNYPTTSSSTDELMIKK